uniref:Ecdysone 20-monooxygenase n=1 Tax=Aceria tosichella TaxID=561515 RepID=A0A6G1SN92_9ACAR
MSSRMKPLSACKHALKFQQAKPFEAIPGPKPSLPMVGTNWIYFPIVGHYQSMKLHEANLDKYHRYGPIMKEEYQRGHSTVTVFDPSDIKEVFLREGACPSRPVLPYVIKHRKSDPSRYPNVGLANMEGTEWLELRSRLAPLLLSRELKKRHITTQNRVSNRLVNYIKSLLPANNNNNNDNNPNHQQQMSNGIHHGPSNPACIDEDDDYYEEKSDMNNQNSGIVKNVQEVFYRFSIESIMNLCINQELGCLSSATGDSQLETTTTATTTTKITGDNYNVVSNEGERMFQAAMNFFEAQHKLYYGPGFWKYFNTKPYRQLCDSENSIHDISSKYIDTALVHLKKKYKIQEGNNNNNNNNNRQDNHQQQQHLGNHNQLEDSPIEEHESLLETLYCTNKFTDLEVKSAIVDFVGGGIYTVANTLTMALFLLASNPSVQEQLYREICEVFKEDKEIGSDITIDMEKLEQLKFLKLCLKESYRLLPTIPGVARTLQRDTVLSNHVVPKNTLVFL